MTPDSMLAGLLGAAKQDAGKMCRACERLRQLSPQSAEALRKHVGARACGALEITQ